MFNNTTKECFFTPCNSEDNKTREFEFYYYEIFFPYAIVIAVLSPVAVAGNGLIFAAIWKKSFVRTPFHILLSGLAFTDLCTGLFAQPFYALTTLMFLANPKIATNQDFVVTTLIVRAIVDYLTSISVLLITLLSVERWLHMSRRAMVTSRRGYFAVIMVLPIPIPFVVFQLINDVNGSYTRESSTAFTVMILGCFFTTAIAYLNVLRIIRRHQRQVQTNESSRNFGQPAINLAKYKKSVISILYIVLLFSFCFLPYLVCMWVYLTLGYNLQIAIASLVSAILVFSSSSLNPVLYVWRMNDIRNGVKKILCKE
ncbi:adenosine receptor A2b-like [Oculina patagonica]